MTYRVVFTPEAEDHLDELCRYIADAATPDIAAAYVDAIITYCEGLAAFPHRGLARDDMRPGLRTTSYSTPPRAEQVEARPTRRASDGFTPTRRPGDTFGVTGVERTTE